MAKADKPDLVEDIQVVTRIHAKAERLIAERLKDMGGASQSAYLRKLIYVDLGLIEEKR